MQPRVASVLSCISGLATLHPVHAAEFAKLLQLLEELHDVIPATARQNVVSASWFVAPAEPAALSASVSPPQPAQDPSGVIDLDGDVDVNVDAAVGGALAGNLADFPWVEGCFNYNLQAILQLRAVAPAAGYLVSAAPTLKNEVCRLPLRAGPAAAAPAAVACGLASSPCMELEVVDVVLARVCTPSNVADWCCPHGLRSQSRVLLVAPLLFPSPLRCMLCCTEGVFLLPYPQPGVELSGALAAPSVDSPSGWQFEGQWHSRFSLPKKKDSLSVSRDIVQGWSCPCVHLRLESGVIFPVFRYVAPVCLCRCAVAARSTIRASRVSAHSVRRPHPLKRWQTAPSVLARCLRSWRRGWTRWKAAGPRAALRARCTL